MILNTLPNTMIFEGVLDENTLLSDLESALSKISGVSKGNYINVDLSKVHRANSSGILVWLKFLNRAGYRFKYINAPVWLVEQFNIISGYFAKGSVVESFQAPFYSPKSQKSINVNLMIGKDVPLLRDYRNYSVPSREFNGETYEADFAPAQYFNFLSLNYDNFSAS
jgi:ABC-type transporter Mla MlaB component